MSSGNDLRFHVPIKNTTEEVIVALRNEDRIENIGYDFTDELLESSNNSITTQGDFQEAVLTHRDSPSTSIRCFQVFNSCDDPANRERCLNFFLQYLDSPEMFLREVSYTTFTPWTLAESQKVDTALNALSYCSRSTPGIRTLDLSGDLFAGEGTFEHILGK